MNDHRPSIPCSCGGLCVLSNHLLTERVMQFLMGLNEEFHHVRAQILLMDPRPSINKVFSLMIQEERQCLIPPSSGSASDAQAIFATKGGPGKGKSQKKDHSICTHCGVTGHTVDKCFKLHGSPRL